MGAAAPVVAAASPLAALGFSVMGTITKGEGDKAAADFKASRAEEAAKFGRLQADLTDTTLRERLNTTLSDAAAIRASGNIDPSSPTSAALADRNTLLSDRQRTAALVTARSQANSDEAGAAYLRKAGDFALTQSYLQAGTEIGKVGAKFALGPGAGG